MCRRDNDSGQAANNADKRPPDRAWRGSRGEPIEINGGCSEREWIHGLFSSNPRVNFQPIASALASMRLEGLELNIPEMRK